MALVTKANWSTAKLQLFLESSKYKNWNWPITPYAYDSYKKAQKALEDVSIKPFTTPNIRNAYAMTIDNNYAGNTPRFHKVSLSGMTCDCGIPQEHKWPCKHMYFIIKKFNLDPFRYFHEKWTMDNYKAMVEKMKPLVTLDLDLIVSIQELDPNIGPQPPTIANKWKDDKIKYKKRGRHKSKRHGKGPGERRSIKYK